MSNEQEKLANHVVETFKSMLGNELDQLIGENNFEALNSLIRDAIGEFSETTLGRVEDVLKQLRMEVERRPLEL